MLATRAPENTQNVVLRVEAPGLGQGADRSAHGLIRHTDEAQGHVID